MIRCLILLLAFLLPMDMEMNAANISSQGQRLVQSVKHTDRTKASLSLGIKFSDVTAALIFILLIAKSLNSGKKLLFIKSDLQLFTYPLIFYGLSLLTLFLNSEYYASNQLMACTAYLTRFLEISLFYLFFSYYALNYGSTDKLMKVFMRSALIASIAGIINPFIHVFSGWLIPDRISFYGVQSIALIYLVTLSLRAKSTKRILGVSRTECKITILLLTLSIFLCGKRSVMFGVIIGILFSFLKTGVSKKNLFTLIGFFIGILIVALLPIYEQITRTINYTHRAFMLDARYSDLYQNSIFASMQSLDPSTAEHIGKWLLTASLLFKHFLLGSGYWGAQYVYNFIPDGISQVVLETGIIGCVVLVLPIVLTWKYIKILSDRGGEYKQLATAWKALVITLLSMGLTTNVVYSFKLLAAFYLFTAITRHYATLFKKGRLNHPSFEYSNNANQLINPVNRAKAK